LANLRNSTKTFPLPDFTDPMKKCSYCGLEYPDEESICAVDHERLVPVGPVPPPLPKKGPPAAPPSQYFPSTPAPIPAATPARPAPSRIARAFQEEKRREIERSLLGAPLRRCACGSPMRAFTSKSATLHTMIIWPLAGFLLATAKTPRTLCYRCEACNQEIQVFRIDLLVAAAVCAIVYGTGLGFTIAFRSDMSDHLFFELTMLLTALFIWSAAIIFLGARVRIKHPLMRAAKSEPPNLNNTASTAASPPTVSSAQPHQ
jgi:hypothetical protein